MQVPFVCGKDDLRLREIEEPSVGRGDVLLRVSNVGICGSDLAYIAKGGITGPSDAPFPLGHELSGVIIEKGIDVRVYDIGDRVILNPLVNLVGNGGTEGGFAERLLVRDVANKPESLLKLPSSISLETGALVEPLAVAAHAVNQMGATPGDKVAVFGAGPIGLAAIAVLVLRGFKDVVAFDLSAFRRERALALGAHAAIDPREEAPRKALQRLHGIVPVFRAQGPGTTHFLEASGAPVIPDIVEMCRKKAMICVVSGQKEPVPIDFMKVMAKELTLTAALGYPTELQDVIDMLERHSPNLEPLVSHRYTSVTVMAAFDMAQRPELSAKVLVDYSLQAQVNEATASCAVPT